MASVGTCFQSALKHFGDPAPDSPHDKASRLARLIQAQRSLLILDGLEPLQYPPNHPQADQLTDPDLRELLGLLAQRNPGLVKISSRQALTDFTSGDTAPTRQHNLGELPVECAVALLRKMQITGTDEELAQAANDYFCRALSLFVLGRFLFVKGGDIRIRKEIPMERANDNRNQRITRNAWHVLEAYEQWLAGGQGTEADASRSAHRPVSAKAYTPTPENEAARRSVGFSRKPGEKAPAFEPSAPQPNAADLQALRLTGLFDHLCVGTDGTYSRNQLGAIGANLGSVAAFYEEPWSRLAANLTAADQARLLNEAAVLLRALGRLTAFSSRPRPCSASVSRSSLCSTA